MTATLVVGTYIHESFGCRNHSLWWSLWQHMVPGVGDYCGHQLVARHSGSSSATNKLSHHLALRDAKHAIHLLTCRLGCVRTMYVKPTVSQSVSQCDVFAVWCISIKMKLFPPAFQSSASAASPSRHDDNDVRECTNDRWFSLCSIASLLLSNETSYISTIFWSVDVAFVKFCFKALEQTTYLCKVAYLT